MGVVRREGNWRLEKQGTGLYEITYDRAPQMQVITPAYPSDTVKDVSRSALPVREVDSSAAAEELFEEQALREIPSGTASVDSREPVPGVGDDVPPGLAMGESGKEGRGRGGEEEAEGEYRTPTGLLAICLIAAGTVLLTLVRTSSSEPWFLFGVGMTVLGVLLFGWAGLLYLTRGAAEAVEFLAPEREEVVSKEGAVIGGATGLFGTVLMHIMGVPEQALIHDSLTYLFETSPLVGYILFTLLGIFLGAFRLVH